LGFPNHFFILISLVLNAIFQNQSQLKSSSFFNIYLVNFCEEGTHGEEIRKVFAISIVLVFFLGDVGGFHVDDVNLTWSATVGLSYTMNSLVDLGIAYRAVKIDLNKARATTVNVIMNGPILGITFHW
jgi:hypothetical protein